MAAVTIEIGGRGHQVACRDGEEDRVRALAAMLDERWPAAARAGGGSGERTFLFVALMLADALDEAQSRPPSEATMSEDALARLAQRLEKLADGLEQAGSAS